MVEVRDGDAVVATLTVAAERRVPALFLLDVVARVHVAACRLGWTVRVLDEDVRELAEFAGLGCVAGEAGRQPERLEQCGVEEVVQPDQPPA